LAQKGCFLSQKVSFWPKSQLLTNFMAKFDHIGPNSTIDFGRIWIWRPNSTLNLNFKFDIFSRIPNLDEFVSKFIRTYHSIYGFLCIRFYFINRVDSKVTNTCAVIISPIYEVKTYPRKTVYTTQWNSVKINTRL